MRIHELKSAGRSFIKRFSIRPRHFVHVVMAIKSHVI